MLPLKEFVQNRYNKSIAECSNEELYLALLNYSKLASSQKPENTGKKKVYYISAEFLIGKLLSNDLINLGLYDEVIELRERTGFPGMKILQFAFNPEDESIDSPHLAPANSVMYTGTHDNNTVLGWYRNEIDDPTREYMARYTNRKEYETVPHAMLRTVFSSVSFMAIATMQDLLELDESARMNFPSTLGGNWSWRMTEDQLTPAVEETLLDLTTIYRRINENLVELKK